MLRRSVQLRRETTFKHLMTGLLACDMNSKRAIGCQRQRFVEERIGSTPKSQQASCRRPEKRNQPGQRLPRINHHSLFLVNGWVGQASHENLQAK